MVLLEAAYESDIAHEFSFVLQIQQVVSVFRQLAGVSRIADHAVRILDILLNARSVPQQGAQPVHSDFDRQIANAARKLLAAQNNGSGSLQFNLQDGMLSGLEQDPCAWSHANDIGGTSLDPTAGSDPDSMAWGMEGLQVPEDWVSMFLDTSFQ